MDVLLFLAIVSTHIWGLLPLTRGRELWDVAFMVAALAVAALSLWRKNTPRCQIGLRVDNLHPAVLIYLTASLLYAGAVLFWYRESLLPMTWDLSIVSGVGGHLWWAFLQQFCLVAFLLHRLRRILRHDIYALLCAAGIFAFFHLPNPFLTLYTLGGGLLVGGLFLRWPSLPAATLAHAVGSTLVGLLLPDEITGWMKVGPLYWMAS